MEHSDYLPDEGYQLGLYKHKQANSDQLVSCQHDIIVTTVTKNFLQLCTPVFPIA